MQLNISDIYIRAPPKSLFETPIPKTNLKSILTETPTQDYQSTNKESCHSLEEILADFPFCS